MTDKQPSKAAISDSVWQALKDEKSASKLAWRAAGLVVTMQEHLRQRKMNGATDDPQVFYAAIIDEAFADVVKGIPADAVFTTAASHIQAAENELAEIVPSHEWMNEQSLKLLSVASIMARTAREQIGASDE